MRLRVTLYDSVTPHLAILGAEYLFVSLLHYADGNDAKLQPGVRCKTKGGKEIVADVVEMAIDPLYWGEENEKLFIDYLTDVVKDMKVIYAEMVASHKSRFIARLPSKLTVTPIKVQSNNGIRVLDVFRCLIESNVKIHLGGESGAFFILDVPESTTEFTVDLSEQD